MIILMRVRIRPARRKLEQPPTTRSRPRILGSSASPAAAQSDRKRRAAATNRCEPDHRRGPERGPRSPPPTERPSSRRSERSERTPVRRATGGKIVDVFQKCRDFTRAQDARDAGAYLLYREIGSPQDPVVTMDGQKVVMLGSNNYLGLTSHPKVKEAAVRGDPEIRDGLRRLPPPERHPRHPRPPRGAPRRLHEPQARHRLLDRLRRERRRALVPARPTRRRAARRDGPRVDHRRRPPELRQGGQVPPQRRGRPREEARPRRRRQGQADRRRRRLLDGGGRHAPARDRAHTRKPTTRDSSSTRRTRLGVFGEHGRGVDGAFRPRGRCRSRDGHLLEVPGDRRRLHRRATANVIDYIQHNARSQIFTAAIPPGAVAAVDAALDILESRARATPASSGEHGVHEAGARGARVRDLRLTVAGDPAARWARTPRRSRWPSGCRKRACS